MNRNIRFISAGAGSGKTYRLTQILEEEIVSGRVRPEAVIATTFTKKAANELVERVRTKLVESGKLEESISINRALIGTVNSVCGRLLVRYAFEAGLSPELEVIDEDRASILFSQALEQSITLDDVRTMNRLQWRLTQEDWRGEISRCVNLARANDIAPDELVSMAELSLQELLRLFPGKVDRDLDTDFRTALETCIPAISANEDSTKKTGNYLSEAQTCLRLLKQNRLPWSEWVKFSKKLPAKRSETLAEPVRDIALLYDSHPGLHQDITDWTKKLFELSVRAMGAYQLYKDLRGLMDFIDQERQMLEVLKRAEVRNSLKQKLDILMVDEFQDTSPIQLGLFLELAALADSTIWVGDIKQAIYGFRGSDPELMHAVVERLQDDDDTIDILPNSYRSRPQLVYLVNELFIPAFSDFLSQDQVSLIPAYPEQSERAALEFWNLKGSNQGKRARALAGGITQLLEEQPDVVDKQSRELRNLKPSDITILSRTHDKARQYAQSLADLGITVNLSRPGLLATPEACLALACLRYMIDTTDTLAGVEIVSLSEIAEPDEWLENRLEFINSGGKPNRWGLEGAFASALLKQLADHRADMVLLSPTESLELALQAGNVERTVIGWGPNRARAAQRLANLETLRGFASDYEDECIKERSAGTAGGLLIWLKNLAAEKLDGRGRDENLDAVNVMTHHAAKGLEWPVIIPADLESQIRPGYWGFSIRDDEAPFDMEQPLANRSIRYWVKPFGKQSAGINIYNQIADSQIGQRDFAKQLAEAKRLLYVSLTRARDILILPLSGEIDKHPWLNCLDATWLEPKEPELTLPSGDTVTTKVCELHETTPIFLIDDGKARFWFPPRKTLRPKPPALVFPSSLDPVEDATIGRIISVGPRLSLKGTPDMQAVGDALHTILCAVNFITDNEEKNKMIEEALDNYGVTAFLDSGETAAMTERFYNKLETELKVKSFLPEWPIEYVHTNGQVLKGWVDLGGELENGWVIIDHKSFPGSIDELNKKALAFSGQLAGYKQAFEAATNKPVESQWIHFSIAGSLIEVCF